MEGLAEAQRALHAVDALLSTPETLLTDDKQERQAVLQMVTATKDKVLMGLEEMGRILATAGENATVRWREEISVALSNTIEAMMALETLSKGAREVKVLGLHQLQQSILSYLETLDPETDKAEFKAFSSAVNRVILDERKVFLEGDRDALGTQIDERFNQIMHALHDKVANGSRLFEIPYPEIEPCSGYKAKITLSMLHIVLAVSYGVLTIGLNAAKSRPLFMELRGWERAKPTRLYIVDRQRYTTLFGV